jgi:hypothetical protein
VGEISIRFRMNMKTGKKDIYIDFESDEDAMRHEHEKEHKKIIERLVGAGILEADEAGEVIVERGQPGIPNKREEPPASQQDAQAQGGGA